TGSSAFNTISSFKRGTSNELKFKIEFAVPTDPARLGPPPFNPFIFTNKGSVVPFTRGTEVHLIDRAPTGAANTTLFHTFQDRSLPQAGKYYRANNNMSFGIDIPDGGFKWPAEKSSINSTYTHFLDWAASRGASYPDWYLPATSNYIESYTYSPEE
ncbi:MAG: DUF4842 domain-containing protein, partial [Bacteroidota bacterium]